MAKITLMFSDGHEHVIEIIKDETLSEEQREENTKALIDGYVTSYTEDHQGVKLEGKYFIGDEPDKPVTDEEENKEDIRVSELSDEEKEKLIEEGKDKDLATLNETFMTNNIAVFYGKEYFINKNDEKELEAVAKESDEVRFGLAASLSKDKLLEWLDRFDLFASLFYMTTHGFDLDTPIQEVENQKLLNIFGHRGITAQYNESTGKWQSVIHVRDGMAILYGTNQLAVCARALITRATGVIFNNNQHLDEMVEHWMKVNDEKRDPRLPEKSALDKLAEKCGTSVKEIEDHFKETVDKLHPGQNTTKH